MTQDAYPRNYSRSSGGSFSGRDSRAQTTPSQQQIARADSAPPSERPALYIHIARQQADAADKLYQAGDAEAGNKALNDVVTYAGKASDAAAARGSG